MNVSSWIVSSKTEAGEGKIGVNLRPKADEKGAVEVSGNVSLTMPAVAALAFEPGREVTLTLEVA